MKKLLAAALGAALVALCLSVATPASAGTTSQYMHPKSSLRYHVDEYVWAPSTTTANTTAAIVGAVPPGKHTLKCIVMHQLTAGAGGGTWKVTPKKNGSSLVLTAGQIGSASGANKAVMNASCPMPTPANAAATDYVQPVLSTTTLTANGGDLLTVDVEFVSTWTSTPSGVLQLFFEPSH